MATKPDMKVDIGGIELQNPVMTASGTFGYGREFDHLIDLNRLGGVIVKGISLLPTKGNPPPRIVETACGMINAIGLENVGIERFIAEKLPFLQDLNPPLMVNIYGKLEEDYSQLAARIDEVAGIDGIEVNISCPNVKAGGMVFGVDPRAAFGVIRAVREQSSKPLIVKLSPNVTDITEIAAAVEEAGADCLSLINTISAMAVDIDTRRPKIANIIGGLSGPAIKPVALRMVWQVAQKSKLPIIGIGGIMAAEDALEFLIAGATAIQVGTANFVNPRATIEIVEGIEDFLIERGIPSIRDIVGTLET
jgi:dihydroorotate dehydrogenase (NAD+) catalytic subunit